MTDDHFLTTEEVLDYLQVNLRTIYRLIKAGKVPAVRVGRQWRFRKRDIDGWLKHDHSHGRRGTPSARRRILVVEDEQAVRDLLVKALAVAEYEVDAAPDGPAANERLQAADYDLLITDF
jgi:excisionase family DNA binding protein